jgi:formylglycine-generating enzyme required for sulfatase activity
VEKASWEDAQIFLTRLNTIEQSAGRLPNGWKYVLPTEAEWEYACRAGTTTAYSWGNDINSSRANYNWDGGGNDGNDSKQTVNIGQFSANPWGFFDMHGNVWEWVSDWKANYLTGAQTDPEGPASGSIRVTRGGSWDNVGTNLRSAKRNTTPPATAPQRLASVLVSKQSSQTGRIPNWNCSGEQGSRVRPGKPGRSQAPRGTMRGTEI